MLFDPNKYLGSLMERRAWRERELQRDLRRTRANFLAIPGTMGAILGALVARFVGNGNPHVFLLIMLVVCALATVLLLFLIFLLADLHADPLGPPNQIRDVLRH